MGVSTESVTYSVSIQTNCTCPSSGTQSVVSLQLVGDDGSSTDWQEFDNFWSHCLQPGDVNHFKMVSRDIGAPMVARIKVKHVRGMDEWLCDRIIVKKGGARIEFPVYDWIQDLTEVARGEAMLPQKVKNPYVKTLRRIEVEHNKATYAWSLRPTRNDPGWGLNRFLGAESNDAMPLLFRCNAGAKPTVWLKTMMNAFSSLMDYSHRTRFDTFEDYHSIYQNLTKEKTPDRQLEGWDTDEYMGRSTLNGISPLSFYRCSELPDGFTVTNDDVSDLLRGGKSLESEMKAGLIYVSDYRKYLEGVSRNKDCQGRQMYCANAQGMFYVRPDKHFVPIAVQLVPGDRDFLFTALDSKWDWLLAKMYFRTAEATFHKWISLTLKGNFITETVGTSLFRCLSRAHPVYKLLRNLVKNVAAHNLESRRNVMQPGGKGQTILAVSTMELIRKYFKEHFNFEDLVIPKLIAKLGLNDRNMLPNFHYRDDALELWEIMQKFVSSLLRNYYKSDEDVAQDYELQGWWRDFVKEGIAWQDGNARGFPMRIDTCEQLVEIVVILMYTSTAQRAGATSVFETCKFVPRTCGSMMMPPHKRGEGSLERIMASLPYPKMGSVLVAMAYDYSQQSDNQVYLGEFPQRLFTDEHTLQCQAQFKADLDEFSAKIKERNSHLEHPYTYLLPERIPFGIR